MSDEEKIAEAVKLLSTYGKVEVLSHALIVLKAETGMKKAMLAAAQEEKEAEKCRKTA